MPMPTAEADSAGSYYRTFLGLPVTLAVETTPFSYIADGRRRDQRTANQQSYGALQREAIVIDGQGRVRWLGNVTPEEEAVLSAVIQETIQ